MAQVRFERDRSVPTSGLRSEGIIWDDGNLKNVQVPDRIGAGDTLTVSGRLDFDYDPIVGYLFPRPARVIVRAGGDEAVAELGGMGRQETRNWSVSLTPSASPGQTLNVEIIGQGDDAFFGWTDVDTRIETVNVQTESQEQVDDAFRYLPWVVGGAGLGGAYSYQQNGTFDTTPVLVGGGVGVVGREYAQRVGVDIPIPEVPTRELAVIGGVLAAGGFLLMQGGNYIPGV